MALRRIRLTSMALLVILLWLVAFAAIPLHWKTLSTLSGLTATYPLYIRLTNCVIAAICAAFLLWPREGSRLVGCWNDYAGLAFATFSVQYGIRVVAFLLKIRFPQHAYTIDLVTDVVVYVGSYLNNILFLAAARILLNKNRKIYEIHPPENKARVFQRLINTWYGLRNALPAWYGLMFLLTLIALLEHPYPLSLWVRWPDAIFSVYCLSWFAYAIWLSFHVRHKLMLAWLGFLLVLAYAAGQLVFAANPLIAYSVSSYDGSQRPPATWVRDYLETEEITESIGQIAVQVRREELSRDAGTNVDKPIYKSEVTQDNYFEGAKKFFDGAIFAILFPMKSLLFLPAFILYLLFIISANSFRKALRETTSMRQDYLSKDGILRAIGKSTEADEVRLIIRLPGGRKLPSKEERVIAEVWSAPETPPLKKEPRIYPLIADKLLIRTMLKEGKEIIITSEDRGEVADKLREIGPSPQTLAVIPIKFHGGVIGVLKVYFRGYGKYNDGTLEQLKFMAELIAPSVQDFRTVSAVDKLGARLNRVQASKPSDKLSPGNKLTGGFNTAAEKMAESLYDLLNPLGIGLFLECGFTFIKPIFPEAGTYHDILKRPEFGYYGRPKQDKTKRVEKQDAEQGKKSPDVVPTAEGPVRVEHDKLIVSTETGVPFELGNLVLAIPDDKDKFEEPTLAAYYLTRRMLASLAANGIFNAARNFLGVVIQDLGVALNQETLSVEDWFDNVETASKKSGVRWVVASEGDGKPLLGQSEHVELITGLTSADKEALMNSPLGCIPYHAVTYDTRHIIHLKLKDDGHHLWLGVERAEFGAELNFQSSPWKVFLLKLANVAGTALARIEERQRAEVRRIEEEDERLKAAQEEWQRTVADIGALLMHQLLNMGGSMRASAKDLLKRIGNSPFAQDDQCLISITNIRKNSVMMMQMTNAFNKATEMGGPPACSISEAAQLTRKLFQFALRKKEIEVEIDAPPEVSVKVPSHVLALALATLIYNAIDAIRSRGRIKIRAKAVDGIVNCEVTNNGQKITPGIIDDLFKPVPKGKKNGHSGRGLYFVYRSLKNYGGEIALSYSTSEETCFTLRLPRTNH
jgi:signal transduction histidine kinase